MAKSAQQQNSITPTRRQAQNPRKFKGIRKRKWGKWVSEVRMPNSRERIWLGTYDTPQQAARAFDAAVYCLRGRKAQFNFPDDPPEIPSASSLSRSEIRSAAARFALSAFPLPSVDETPRGRSPSLAASPLTEIESPFEWECWESLLAVAQTDDPSDSDIFACLDMSTLDSPFPSASLENGDFAVDQTDLWSSTTHVNSRGIGVQLCQ